MNKYNTSVVFDKQMIAPCGMNCGACLGYMRSNDHCPGCRVTSDSKPISCIHCIIINCDLLKSTASGFCYECPKYPCARLKRLDKRYRTRYQTSFFDNLKMIKENGIDYFLSYETGKRTCPECGSTLCIHRPACFSCGFIHQKVDPAIKPFNDSVMEYRKLVEKGDIVLVYRGLLEYMMNLRTQLKNKYPEFNISGNFYHGYMDMTFFSLVPEFLKNRGLKVVIVLLHDKMSIEAWLAGSNKVTQLKYWEIVRKEEWDQYRVPRSIIRKDSIVECSLVENPDFGDTDALTRRIESGTRRFLKDVESFLESI